MNEVALSDDLTQLTTEIKTYQSIGGQAIFEIGRRLKWVKEHDLAHGEYLNWLSSLNIDRTQASRFIKIAKELPNDGTYQHLGMRVLSEIATMPPDEREKQHHLPSGEVKKPDEMTVRELREVKKQLKHREEELDDRNAELEQLRNQKPKVVEKQVEIQVEKQPDDYEALKEQVTSLKYYKDNFVKLQNENDELNKKVNDYASSEQLENQVDRWKNRGNLSAYKTTSDVTDFIRAHKLTSNDKRMFSEAGESAHSKLSVALDDLSEWINEVRVLTNGRAYIEGEVIDDK